MPSEPLFELLVDEITSVGLVPAGDNPDATVAFWKAKAEAEDPGKTRNEQLAERLTGFLKRFDDAHTFTEALRGETMDEVLEEVWTVISALHSSVVSTLADEDEPDPESLIRGSLDQFDATFLAALPEWLEGNPTGQFSKTEKTSGDDSGKNPTYPNGSDSVGKQAPPSGGEVASSRRDNMPDESPTLSDEAREGLGEEAVAYLTHLEEQVAGIEPAVQAAVEKALAEAGDGSGDGDGESETEIMKGLTDEQAAAFQKVQDDLEAAKAHGDEQETRIAKMERDNQEAHYAEIAKGFPGLGSEDEDGESTDIAVRTIEAVENIDDADVQENLYKALRAREALASASTVVKGSPLRVVGGESDQEQAIAIVKAKADELREGDTDLTDEQAFDAALDEVEPAVAQAAVAAPSLREG